MLCYLLNGYDVLQAIRECGCLRAPEPYACGDLALGGSYLLMEHMPFIPFGQSIPDGQLLLLHTFDISCSCNVKH
jgi:hypothetical protein